MVQNLTKRWGTQRKEASDTDMAGPAGAVSVEPVSAGGIGSSGTAAIAKGQGWQSRWGKGGEGRTTTLSAQQVPMSALTHAAASDEPRSCSARDGGLGTEAHTREKRQHL